MSEHHERARNLELALAEVIRGQVTPGSGSGAIKGDARSRLFLGEAKSYSGEDAAGTWLLFQLEWLETITAHARSAQRYPVLALEWQCGRRGVLVMDDLCKEASTVLTGTCFWNTARGRGVKLYSRELAQPESFEFLDLRLPWKVWTLLSWESFAELVDFFFQKEAPAPAAEPARGGFTPRTEVSRIGSASFGERRGFQGGGGRLSGGSFRKRGE